MTRPFPPVLVRAEEAEHLDLIGHVLLADSSATAGALSSHRVALGRGADGAVPHRHDHSAELFYILDGAFDLLAAGDVLTLRHPLPRQPRLAARPRGRLSAPAEKDPMNSYFAAELVKTRQTGLAAEASRARPRSSAPSARLAASPPMELTSEGRTCCLAHFNAHRAIYSPQVPPAEAGAPGA